jgi:type II secretory pathway component PulK
VLVAVMIVIALLSWGGYAFTELMFTEHKATRLQGHAVQARLAAESGVELVKSYLMLTEQQRQEFGGHTNNPEHFQGVSISGHEAGDLPGRVSIIAPPLADEDPPKLRFGLRNESTKLNLRALLDWDARQPGSGRNALLNLPGMTEDLADAILDWIDSDDVARELGAESDYYSRLEPAYAPANAVPEALEELLWVRGVTPNLLFGADRNQNGYIDAGEYASSQSRTQDDFNSVGMFGWSTWLTLRSVQAELTSSGQPKIDLNHPNLQELYEQLLKAFNEEWATFIIAYRQFGPYVGPAASASGRPLPPDLALPSKFQLATLLDLVAVRVQVVHPNIPPFVLPCPFENNRATMREFLPKLVDQATVGAGPVIGRIDVNQAPREVLLAVPSLSAGLVEDIISKRGSESDGVDETRRHVTWLLLEGLVELEQMKELMRYLTVGGDVFSAQTVGYLEDGTIYRAEFTLDATFRPPLLVSWRDLQRLGRGYDLSLLGLTPRGETSRPSSPTSASNTP